MKLPPMLLSFTALLTLVAALPAADPPPPPVSDPELIKLINDYRASKKLPPVKVSPELTKVAAAHLNDLVYNRPQDQAKSLFAWSNKGKWTPGAPGQDGKDSWKIMWLKPKEIAGYEGHGFELAYYDPRVSTQEVMDKWIKDIASRDVLLNQGRYATSWNAVGAARGQGYFIVWFGQ